MSTVLLKSLSIENLRGSVTPFVLKFEKGKKLMIIYGENGTGKSTISDAFDLLGNSKVGSLEKRGVGASTRVYWPSLGKAYADVKVTLETSNGTCVLSLDKKNVFLNQEELKPKVSVLRRSEILRLVTAQPADRYKEISRFIDVSGIEASEASLRKLINDKTKDFENAITRVSTNRKNIENFWEQVNRPFPDAILWAECEAKKDSVHFEKRKNDIDCLISFWNKIEGSYDKFLFISNELKEAILKLSQAESILRDIKEKASEDYLEVMDILQAAKKYFHKHDNVNVCPLCESAENAENLVEEVNKRIELNGLWSQLNIAQQSVLKNENLVKGQQQRLDDFLKDIKDSFNQLEGYCLNTLEIQDLDLPSFPIPENPNEWQSWIAEHQGKKDVWRQESDKCVDNKNFIETLRRSLDDLKGSENVAKELGVTLPSLKEILNIIESERKKYTDHILGSISVRVGQLYELIHPKEGLDKITLALDAAKRGSLEIAMEFAGEQDTPPQAYFSDSHLDTLGLCVFLALAERENPEQKILVLDDVLGSVDEPHVERVITMIYDVIQKFQHAIVTTHYRPWREKFRWGVLKPEQVCQFVELKHWSLDNGMSLSGSIPEVVRLKKLLEESDPDIQSITGKSGVILEALLDFLTLKYSCAVPRKIGNIYVLSDLLGAVNSKLLKELKVEIRDQSHHSSEVQIGEILKEINQIAQTRNVLGAHFNEFSFNLYPQDGLKFARLVEKLCDALICPDYGWPNKDTGSYWKNGGDTRRLYPLKKPS
ncbi:AAA family ATPase [Bisgaard Taxon 45]|uniref:AAA family ATPase n=1 Tax=Bisgaard Taxon 45 TaxID=304289 RepID=A0ABT9KCB8_9PAST|nr:AAA family ATPase [Bisgaard Taxon 45]